MPDNRLDLLIIGAYFFVVLVLGWIKRKDPDGEDYLLMGRRLTLPGFLLSLISSWYGGILGSSEYSYAYGLSNWIVFGVPYYVFAGVFALFLARKARERYVFSIPDMIAGAFGEKSRVASGVLVLILASPAPYVLTLGVLLNFLFGIPVIAGILIGGLFSYLYVFRDGLSVIIRTDFFQCLLMYGGYFILIAYAWMQWGNPLHLVETIRSVSPERVSLTGGASVSYILVWFFIASWTLVSPMFHQRVYALRNGRYAKPGIFLSIALWCVFDLLTTLAGLYAFAQLPDLADARVSHLLLAENLLPAGAYGLFITGIFAVVMSTLDSELFVSGVTLGPDILGRVKRLRALGEATLTRLGMGLVVMSAMVFAIYIPSVVSLYYTIGTLAVPGLLLPVLSAAGVMPRMRAHLALVHLIAVPGASLTWYLMGISLVPGLQAVEPFYPGMMVSLTIFGIDRYDCRRRGRTLPAQTEA